MTSPEYIGPNIKGHVLGWGPVNNCQHEKYLLQKLELTTIDNEECAKILRTDKIRGSHLCAISPVGNIVTVSTLHLYYNL